MLPPSGVEDPISAIFDLSDRVAEMAPVVRRLYRYTAGILVAWILIMGFVAFIGLRDPFLTVLALLGLIAGVIALTLLRRTDRFFRGFVQRHRAIHLVRDADPLAKVPEGRTPVERLGRYLVTSNDRVAACLRESPEALRYRVAFPVAGGSVPFDLVLVRPGSAWWRTFGTGDPGFAILARTGVEAPTLDDLRRFEAEAKAVAARLPGQLVRLILLRSQPIPLPEAVYDYVVGHPFDVRRRFGGARVGFEVITENPDGTYEFVPHVLGVP